MVYAPSSPSETDLRENRWGCFAYHAGKFKLMLENEVRRDGLGKIKKDAKEDG